MNQSFGQLFQDSELNYFHSRDAESLQDCMQQETLCLPLPVYREGSKGFIAPVLFTLTCTPASAFASDSGGSGGGGFATVALTAPLKHTTVR